MKWTLESTFTTRNDGVKISYAALTHGSDNDTNKNDTTIAFFTGYKEAYNKYLPYLARLHTEGGFNIYTMDHRNQGLSGDTPGTIYEKGFPDTSGRRICYVEDFDSTYVEDMRQFLEEVVKPQSKTICVVTHSMGGTIAARLAELTGKSLFDRMALSAPMMLHKNILAAGVDVELPIGFASSFGSFMVSMKQGKVKADGRDTNAAVGTTELLTHCTEKRALWDKLRTDNPTFVLGGASFAWAKAAIEVEERVMQDLEKIQIPTLVFMAEDDAFVYNSGTIAFVNGLDKDKAKSELIGPIANSYHELLFETDDVSVPIWNAIQAFASVKEGELSISAFPESVTSALDKIPRSKITLDDNVRFPAGFHSGWKPPSFPVPLVFKSSPNTRYFLATVMKGVALATLIQCGIGLLSAKKD